MAYGYRTPGSGRKSVPISIRFRKYFIEGKPDECWLWRGASNSEESGGHGRIRDYVVGRNVLAHRLSYEVHHGVTLSPDIKVLHRCDVGHCVNPAHLFLGTQADNMADMKAKNRGHDTRGNGNGNAKLIEDYVRYIREQLAGGRSQHSLARAFRVTARMIGLIARGKSWTHICSFLWVTERTGKVGVLNVGWADKYWEAASGHIQSWRRPISGLCYTNGFIPVFF